MTTHAMFLRSGPDTYVPTAAAMGAWNPTSLHGGAVGALVAGRMARPGSTLARFTLELLAQVPNEPLTLTVSEPVGGRRAQRQHAILSCGGRTVVTAASVSILHDELDLPPAALQQLSPFDPAAAPPLAEARRELAGSIGWENFHSLAVATKRLRPPDDPAIYEWIALTVPVVDGQELTGVEIAAAAADLASGAANRRLPYESWQFKNTELTMHLSREPIGRWIGTRVDAIVQRVGVGIASAQLFDASGRLGQSASTLVIEARPPLRG